MTIGDRIRARRQELGFSVDELAARLGKNRATVYRYENGAIENLPISVLEPLAKALETTLAYLIGSETISIGARIRQLRIEKDITQQELADCAGVSKQAVYKYENNIVTNIPMDKLSIIASKLGVSPCFLMGWEDNNSVPEVPDTIKAALQQEDGKVAEIMELFVHLPADKQQEALSYLRYLSASANK